MTGPLNIVMVTPEDAVGSHPDVHRALEFHSESGLIGSAAVVEHRMLTASGASCEEVGASVLRAVDQVGADAVIWSHTTSLQIPESALDALLSRGCMSALWDGDWYEWPYKPVPRAMQDLAKRCVAAFIPGEGSVTEVLRSAGCPRVEYFPLTTDERFYHPSEVRDHDFDVVLIGNRVSSRLPWKTMPGARWRVRLVRAFEDRFGSRFAVFGEGWHGPCAQGPLPFEEQPGALSRALVTIGVNNLHARYYFSNRLPIALSCRRPVVHNAEPGLLTVVPPGLGVRTYQSTAEALRVAEAVAVDGMDASELDRGESFACERLSMRFALGHLLRVLVAIRDGQTPPPNPWIAPAHVGGARR